MNLSVRNGSFGRARGFGRVTCFCHRGGAVRFQLNLRSKDVPKRNTLRIVAAVLVTLAYSVASPNPAMAAALQHHGQVPGFYRLQVGDLEVTALWDGAASFDPHWLQGQRTIDGVVKALQADPHMLDVSDDHPEPGRRARAGACREPGRAAPEGHSGGVTTEGRNGVAMSGCSTLPVQCALFHI